MTPNRRQRERRVPDKLAFIQMDRDDGGTVLNISEGGLCFEVFTPVLQGDLIHFWFSLNLKDRIEAIGKLVWTDATKKVGGLKFLALSQHAHEQIRTWMKLASPTEKQNGDHLSVAARGFDASPRRAREPGSLITSLLRGRSPKAEKLRSQRPPAAPPVLSTPGDQARAPKSVRASVLPERRPDAMPLHYGTDSEKLLSETQSTSETLNVTQLVPQERYFSATRRQFVRGVFLGILISSAVAIPAFKYSGNHKQMDVAQAASAQKASIDPATQVGVSAPATVLGATSTSLDTSSRAKAQRAAPMSHPADNPFAPPPVQPHTKSLGPARGTQPTLTAVQSRPEAKNVPKKTEATPQQLWSAVQAGNAKAAVTLADLYMRGAGVPLNCDQARVLLLVASEKNNADAIRKLRELDKGGCPAP